jgi:hypothetical protein
MKAQIMSTLEHSSELPDPPANLLGKSHGVQIPLGPPRDPLLPAYSNPGAREGPPLGGPVTSASGMEDAAANFAAKGVCFLPVG